MRSGLGYALLAAGADGLRPVTAGPLAETIPARLWLLVAPRAPRARGPAEGRALARRDPPGAPGGRVAEATDSRRENGCGSGEPALDELPRDRQRGWEPELAAALDGVGDLARSNQRASSTSSRGRGSPPAQSAMKPSMSELGNGHGCEET